MRKKLVFLHGGPGFKDYLRPFFEGKFPDTVDCVFYTQKQELDTTLESLLLEIDGHVEDHHSCVLVGHSWGGVLALEYLRHYPSRGIKGLVFMDSFLSTKKLDAAFKAELQKQNLSQHKLEDVFFCKEELALGHEFHQRRLQFDLPYYESLHASFLDAYDAEDFFKTLTIPILNLYGKLDLRTPHDMLVSYQGLNKHVKNVGIPETGHFPFLQPEKCALVVEEILKFLSLIQS